jgi:outer membrane receptor for ferrienterochelin and colicins
MVFHFNRRCAPSGVLIVALAIGLAGPSPAQTEPPGLNGLEEIQVTARRLNEARNSIQTQTGASTYTVDSATIAAAPGGDNTLLNQVILQVPSVAQDSFGQFHIRGEHNGLQYRLNGIALPEGIAVFGQSLDPRLISKLSVITGALPAEYGLRTAGIIDLTAKSGSLDTGGSLSLYGGSHATLQPSLNFGGTSGPVTYFVSGGMLKSDLGIESPDGSGNPVHDHTTQYHGFGYFEDIVDEENRLSAILATSVGRFEIPNRVGLQPDLGLTVNGVSQFPSENLDEHQREVTHFGVLGWQHSAGPLNVQTSLIARYSSLTFVPDATGSLLYSGIAEQAFKRNVAYALQSDGSYRLDDSHTLRGGVYLQSDRSLSDTSSSVLPVDAAQRPIGDTPVTIVDNTGRTETIGSGYLQDEWQLNPVLTVNFGLRFDRYSAFGSESQLSPRLNAVWKATGQTTVHGGYARYFSPPPFELVGSESLEKFANTTAAPATTQNDLPRAERAHYYDFGVEQRLTPVLTISLDTYYKQSAHLVDEGQFGAPIILTPFNYRFGRQYGAEIALNYASGNLSAYLNLSVQSARGKLIESSQFNFLPSELAYIAANAIHLDHEQAHTASGGASYLWNGTRISMDFLFGSGLRSSLALPAGQTTPYGGVEIPNGDHLPSYAQLNLGLSHVFRLGGGRDLTLRFDAINVLDRVYQIRDGTGVGVGAPQYGPRRGLFAGLAYGF